MLGLPLRCTRTLHHPSPSKARNHKDLVVASHHDVVIIGNQFSFLRYSAPTNKRDGNPCGVTCPRRYEVGEFAITPYQYS
ncbi:hypothetical protein PAXRUDRAFT_693452 [Paxillus rubicundulus Ve08.2h10]|uniref:Uncharacterized protein n=1 Tax=Paxillus rubicundulus Ve08.2h10 TaxID=930991 RepID=A0A0D0DWC3_9AGAM|nr:hypothetical protein PAXRUDRAFT_693452 [Paxillus rubicundulus Ve08.2h10]